VSSIEVNSFFIILGSVHVVVEHCVLGCLEEYLRNHRGSFLDEFREKELGSNVNPAYVTIDHRFFCLFDSIEERVFNNIFSVRKSIM